jgi:hypothetical protein
MKNVFKLAIGLFVVAGLGLTGCGGGGGGDTGSAATPVVESSKTYSTAKLFPLSSTAATSFTLTGSDNAGGTWTGSWLMRGDGQTVFEGKNVTKITQQISMKLTGATGSATSSSNVTSYYNADQSLYKAIYSGAASGYAIQTNNFVPPLIFKIGDAFTGPAMTSYINGVTEYQTSTYQINDGGNGNAKVSSTIHYTSGNSATTEQIITPTGDLVSMKMVMNYPSLGRTVTLYGSR